MVYILIEKLPQTFDAQRSAEALMDIFGKEHVERILTKGHPLSRDESLFALELLERAVGGHFPDTRDLTITRTEGGKPYFAREDAPRFSISHSEGVCAVALSDSDVGIDIQGERNSLERISKRYFSSDSDADALLLWTQKEAYAKLFDVPLAAVLSSDVSGFASYKFFEYLGKKICVATKSDAEISFIT